MKIKIVTIGFLDTIILQHLKHLIIDRFNIEAVLGSNIAIESFTKDEHRNQYLSTGMLKALANMRRFGEDVLLGVADVDLYVPSLNFVFGEADLYNRVAVISIARLRPSFYGLQDDECLLLKRAGKEVIHELGHVFKLGHCVHPKCVMFFSNSLPDTDLKEDSFCQKCKKSLDMKT